jgi:hypothetical protein
MIKLNLNPDRRILGQFSILASFMFAVVGLVLVWKWGASWTLFAVLAAIGVIQFALHQLGIRAVTLGLYVVLTLVAFPIGFVLSHVLIAVIYYLVITPIGLLFRLVGRDAMMRRPDPSLPSYWHARPTSRPAASYFKLY